MSEMDEDMSTPTADFRLRPSRNQKQRSKLKQIGEPSPQPPAAPEPEEIVPAPAPATPPPAKKFRLKRSGQMHKDLTAPMPESPNEKKRSDVY